MTKKVLLLSFAILFLSGCTSLERTAYNVIVSSNAFLKKVKSNHPECIPTQAGTTGTPSQTCVLLSQATAGKDALIDAIEVYCSGPNFNNGGACDPPKKGQPGYQSAVDKLSAALNSYEQLEKDLKGALGR